MPDTNPGLADWTHELSSLRDELRGMASEMEQMVRLSSFDMRDRWSRLEPCIEEFEERSRETTMKQAARMIRTGRDLRARLLKLRRDCW
jgi:hypothetical protein